MKRYCVQWGESVLAALLLLNLLAACTLSTDTPPQDPTVQRYAAMLRQEGATLNLYWPASGTVKTWITDTLVPGYKKFMKDIYGISMTVNILPAGGGDIAFFQKLTAYEQKNPNSGDTFGIDLARIVPSLDLLAAGKRGWLLPILPRYTALLPNLASVNKPGLSIFTINGQTTYALPVYQPTISFFYNKDRIPSPPRSVTELMNWVKAHPRRFTYEDPRMSSQNGFGSGIMFLLMVMKIFGNPDDPGTYSNGFAFLKQLQTYVYPEPVQAGEILNLMKHDDIWLMPYWNNDGISVIRQQNISFMLNYFPEEGAPVRNTPIAIPGPAQHRLAALFFMNYILSDNVQRTMALKLHQFPASASAAVWQDLQNTFGGGDINDIRNHIYQTFNNEANLRGIQAMVDEYPKQVL